MLTGRISFLLWFNDKLLIGIWVSYWVSRLRWAIPQGYMCISSIENDQSWHPNAKRCRYYRPTISTANWICFYWQLLHISDRLRKCLCIVLKCFYLIIYCIFMFFPWQLYFSFIFVSINVLKQLFTCLFLTFSNIWSTTLFYYCTVRKHQVQFLKGDAELENKVILIKDCCPSTLSMGTLYKNLFLSWHIKVTMAAQSELQYKSATKHQFPVIITA